MDYTQRGYDITLTRIDNLSTNEQIDPLQFDLAAPEFPGSKLTGVLQSQSGRVKLDLDGEKFIATDGIVELIRLGKQDDNSYGLVVKDKDGNILMKVTTNENYIQNGDGRSRLDFIANRYTVKEVGGNTRIILGDK